MDTSKVNINELIDKARFTSFHWKVRGGPTCLNN